jgi:hypothetical protein
LFFYSALDTNANSEVRSTGFGVGVTIAISIAFGGEARAHWVGILSWISGLTDELAVAHSSSNISAASTANLKGQVLVANVVFAISITAWAVGIGVAAFSLALSIGPTFLHICAVGVISTVLEASSLRAVVSSHAVTIGFARSAQVETSGDIAVVCDRTVSICSAGNFLTLIVFGAKSISLGAAISSIGSVVAFILCT